MSTSYLYPGWVLEFLKTHLSEEELGQLSPFIHAETWASPSAQKRYWPQENADIPLRFHLEIDMKI
ncbi:MAG: hypothetical protein WBZ33_11125 [Thermoactinomyces sp.]|jgi:hypothetical protein